MKLLDVSSVTDSAQMPIKKGTLQFLQDAYRESLASTIIALIGAGYNSSVVYILSGVVNSGTYPVYNVTPGTIFYNGEVFTFDAASFTASGSNVGIFSIIQTQYNTDADPVTFTDTTVRNVHNIRKMLLSQASSGSGIANFTQAFTISFSIPLPVNLIGAGAAVISGVYPNLTITVPVSGLLNPVLYAGSYNVGDIVGGNDFSITFASVGTSDYYVMGTVISNGTVANDRNLTWVIRNRSATGFTLSMAEWSATVQNVAFEYILFAK